MTPLPDTLTAEFSADEQRLFDAMRARHSGVLVTRKDGVATIRELAFPSSYGNVQRCPVRPKYINGRAMYSCDDLFKWAVLQLRAAPPPNRNRYPRGRAAHNTTRVAEKTAEQLTA